MDFLVVLALFGILGTAIVLPTSASQTCECTDVSEPVCGSDGNTYTNDCEMSCVDGITAVHAGPCRPPCLCPRIYMPVCGANGQTYINQCDMQCQGVILASQGPCVNKRAARGVPCICTFQYDPVCGVDGITYGNECSLNCKGEPKAHNGECAH